MVIERAIRNDQVKQTLVEMKKNYALVIEMDLGDGKPLRCWQCNHYIRGSKNHPVFGYGFSCKNRHDSLNHKICDDFEMKITTGVGWINDVVRKNFGKVEIERAKPSLVCYRIEKKYFIDVCIFGKKSAYDPSLHIEAGHFTRNPDGSITNYIEIRKYTRDRNEYINLVEEFVDFIKKKIEGSTE